MVLSLKDWASPPIRGLLKLSAEAPGQPEGQGQKGAGSGASGTLTYFCLFLVQTQGELKGLEAVVLEGGSDPGNVEGVRVEPSTEGREA